MRVRIERHNEHLVYSERNANEYSLRPTCTTVLQPHFIKAPPHPPNSRADTVLATAQTHT